MSTSDASTGIKLKDNTDVVSPLAGYVNEPIQSIIDYLKLRKTQGFYWPIVADKNAATGMRTGDLGYQVDIDTTYRYDGTTWKLWSKPRTLTPVVISNWASTGAKTEAAYYSVSEGIVHFWGYSTVVGTPTVGVMGLSLPVAGTVLGLNPNANAAPSMNGNCTFQDASATTSGRYYGWLNCTDGLTGTFRIPASGVFTNTGSTSPFTWATGDSVAWDVMYEAA